MFFINKFLLELVIFIIYIIGLMGIFLTRKNIIILLMSVEIILLSINLNFITSSLYLNDLIGQVMAIFVLTIAAAEAAIGLTVLIVYYRVKGKITTQFISIIKK